MSGALVIAVEKIPLADIAAVKILPMMQSSF